MASARADTLLFFKDRPYWIVLYIFMMIYYPVRTIVVPYYLGKLTSIIGEIGENSLKKNG